MRNFATIIFLCIASAMQAQNVSVAYPNAAWGAGQYLGMVRYIHPSHVPGTKDPVIIWLHGNGGAAVYNSASASTARGRADYLRSTEGGLPRNLETGTDISARKANNGANPLERFVVLAPCQEQSKDDFVAGITYKYVEYTLQYIRDSLLDYVDTNRIYIIGYSGGGTGSRRYITKGTMEAFKAAASVHIAAVIADPLPGGNWCNIVTQNHATWFFHAQNDGAVDDIASATAVSSINNSCGATGNYRALYFNPAGGGHTSILDSALNPARRRVDATGVSAPTSSMNIYEWMLQFERDYDAPATNVCPSPYLLPVPEYRVYDFSGASAEYKGVRSNVKGTGSAQYLFRNDYNPRAGIIPPTDTINRYYPMPRQSNSRASIYRDGFHKIWVDFRRMVKIDTMYILHNTYVSDSMYVILDADSTYWNNPGSIREIPEYFRITPKVATKLPTNNGNQLTTKFTIEDSARFMLILVKNIKTTYSADSMSRPLRIALYGCSDEPIAINDSTWTGPRKKPWPINKNSGSNMTTEELAFAPGKTRNHMDTTEHIMRRYGQRGPNYGWDNDSTAPFNLANRTNKYNFSFDDWVSDDTFFEGIYGYDSVMYSRYQPYIFRAEQGPSAYAAKKLRDGGYSSSSASYGWAPIDSPTVNYKLPSSYARAGDAAWQVAAITGRTPVDTNYLRLKYRAGQYARTALGIHKGFQNENEMNGYYKPRMFNPIEYDASSQAMYDGDEGTIGPRIGVKVADPTMEFIAQSLAQHDLQEARAIMYLSRMNREDRKMIYDVMCYNAYWVEWDDKRQSVTTTDYNYTKKAYPESDTALAVLNILADETYIQTGDTTSYTAYTEYGTDHTYRRPVNQSESFSISIYSTPKYRNAAGTILDSSASHAIDVIRDQLAGVMSNMTWMTQYVLRDLVDTTSGGRFYPYSYSGKLNPFNKFFWGLWYLDAGIKTRFGNYVKDSVLAYQDHGLVAYRLKHKDHADSLLYIVYYGDTLGTTSYDLNVGTGKAAIEWQESYVRTAGTEVSATVTDGHITGTASPEFTFLLVYPSGAGPDPDPPPVRPDNLIQRSGQTRLRIISN